jgi:glycosyltransferase involved in cell wall biosynthesis
MLHYSSPPIVGGVESLIGHQAHSLVKAGYDVRVISGEGGPLPEPIETRFIPLLSSRHADVLQVKSALDQGQVPPEFELLVQQIELQLAAALADCDICVSHNLHTMNKNLPLTAALRRIMERMPMTYVAFGHDIAVANPQYRAEFYPGYPWQLLTTPWPRTQYATISIDRQQTLAALFGWNESAVTIVYPGVDPAQFYRWTETTRYLVKRLHLLEADGLLLMPVRLTRRKNVELALHILKELRQQSALDFRLIVTGPPGPHNPTNITYLTSLLDLRHSLELEGSVHFLYACGPNPQEPLLIDDATMSDLYHLSDGLLFPSLQEGFGIPILEAGLTRLPIFCADIPPLRDTAQDAAVYFDPVDTSAAVVADQMWAYFQQSPIFRLSQRVRHNYQWDRLITDHLIPLFDVEAL